MELKQLRKALAEEAKEAGICREWLEKIRRAPSREYLLQLFAKGLDFAILTDFPSAGLAAEFDDIAPHYGIYLHRKGVWSADRKKRVIARETTVDPATFQGYDVGEVYALRGSAVKVKARGNAIVAVTVEEGGFAEMEASEQACIRLFRHGGQIVTRGNVKIIKS